MWNDEADRLLLKNFGSLYPSKCSELIRVLGGRFSIEQCLERIDDLDRKKKNNWCAYDEPGVCKKKHLCNFQHKKVYERVGEERVLEVDPLRTLAEKKIARMMQESQEDKWRQRLRLGNPHVEKKSQSYNTECSRKGFEREHKGLEKHVQAHLRKQDVARNKIAQRQDAPAYNSTECSRKGFEREHKGLEKHVQAHLRKQDVARNKIAQRQDAPAAILQAKKLNDPDAVRKRSKMCCASDLLAKNEELTEGSAATRALLTSYSQTPRQGMTPMRRTPRRTPAGKMTPMRTHKRTPAGKGDAIMMEAESLARLRDSQKPLLGGENPELHPSDFTGVTPRKKEIQTPNPMSTPSMSPGTPFRVQLHINEDMDMHESAKLERQRREEARRSLRSGLTGQIVAQPPREESEEPAEKIEEDMSDKIAREKAEEEARQQALLKKRSKVLQRDLPRTSTASLEVIRNSLLSADGDKISVVPPTPIEVDDKMVREELLQLLEHDNAKYPLDEKAEKKKGAKNRANRSASQVLAIDDFDENELQEADKMIKEEGKFLCVSMGHENKSLDDFVEANNTWRESESQ
ncbi:unnamed protein product [Arabidopsis arenosa]|uniref:Pre-mRNA splicing factor component Cdc5p/Cef1 C-terminal domain-containing protein n=1 Tax=Arabidopsis arenosa TaxID=38785 RepID=A0A8S1ZCM1_ARAAE|nr:unnamed protein product [Arabidopsis arenosa]